MQKIKIEVFHSLGLKIIRDLAGRATEGNTRYVNIPRASRSFFCLGKSSVVVTRLPGR